MTSRSRVHVDLTDGVATVTLDHPPLNVYDLAMRDELIECLCAARDWPDLHILFIVTAIGHFGVGADISEFGSAEHPLEARRIRWDRDPWRILRTMPAPTVALLDGYVLGSGLEMALLCDMRIGTPDSIIGLPEIHLGMLPAAGGTQSLTRLIGPDRALDLIITGRRCDAAEAHRLGIVDEIVEDLGRRRDEIARTVATLERDLVRTIIPLLRPETSVGALTAPAPAPTRHQSPLIVKDP